ncbi:glycosyltransferase family 2 protein [Albidovulum sediminicola]|uniref:Glycosyltransferase family 2 protein n=1 Tax=Albidovulum sediminicola TaxID=2984331 RepID=A0ABT2Z6Z6_9RHOB|nr:glycosyltransferase family 2 protein [Defluviimonas sp. WL0075]MCV2866861.1 glycosyltransferase family 2 protein [Defluviimonas sp. WL0075]
MKDEGPFVLEWVAYHRSIGVSDFVIVSNDCTDGTDLILDRLDDMGWIRHLPNPTMLGLGDVPIQHTAIAYAQMTKEFRRADWALVIDADEFLNINVGDGTLAALLAEVGDIDAISFNQVVFGSSGVDEFIDMPTLQQFTRRFRFERPMSERFPRMYGIKTLARNDAGLFRRHANHRPIPFARKVSELRWLDGSGAHMPEEFCAKAPRGYRTEAGTHALGYINHYAVRSVESFMIQSFRGDAVSAAVRRDLRYWRQYDRNDVVDATILGNAERAARLHAALMEDAELRELHLRAVEQHRQKLKTGLKNAEVRALYDEILASRALTSG